MADREELVLGKLKKKELRAAAVIATRRRLLALDRRFTPEEEEIWQQTLEERRAIQRREKERYACGAAPAHARPKVAPYWFIQVNRPALPGKKTRSLWLPRSLRWRFWQDQKHACSAGASVGKSSGRRRHTVRGA